MSNIDNSASTPTARQTVEKRVIEVLITHGWSTENTTLARKRYITAVGPKEAHCYLQDFGPASESFSLTGTYWSEGRNALEPCLVLIPKTANAFVAASLAKQFVVKADKAISETYAARLAIGAGYAECFVRCDESSVGVLRSLCKAMVAYDVERGGVTATLSAEERKRLDDFPADFKVEPIVTAAGQAVGAAPEPTKTAPTSSSGLEL